MKLCFNPFPLKRGKVCLIDSFEGFSPWSVGLLLLGLQQGGYCCSSVIEHLPLVTKQREKGGEGGLCLNIDLKSTPPP